MIYFTSDLHLGHKNILAYDNRPFTSIGQHDEEIIHRWNSVVNVDDTVYILGDISWHPVETTVRILRKLNGKKILVVGNHDNKLVRNYKFKEQFEQIEYYMELPMDNGKKIVLCHYPIPCFNGHYHGAYHFYGHVHNSFEENMMMNTRYNMEQLYELPCNMYNIGCMLHNYTPQTFDQIVNGGDVTVRT